MKATKCALVLVFLLLSFSVFTAAVSTMPNNPFNLTTEKSLTNHFNPAILSFWEEHAKSTFFQGVDTKKIHTVSIVTGNEKAIVISQGRNESVLKYKELAYDLHLQGYDIFLIDHRGQGLSERLGGDQYRGHVENFQDYVDDLNQYISSLALETHYQQRYLLSHSMGGAISSLYLQQYKHPFQSSVFFSPMFSINFGPLPDFLAKIVTYTSAEICSWFSDKACYIPGGSGYEEKDFSGNRLTSSQFRFNSAQQEAHLFPKIQLGDATMRWVATSISATEQAILNASKIKIPILIIHAGSDEIVTKKGQIAFFENVTFCKQNSFLNIENAKHEILLERDELRLAALTPTLQFLNDTAQGKQTCTK